VGFVPAVKASGKRKISILIERLIGFTEHIEIVTVPVIAAIDIQPMEVH